MKIINHSFYYDRPLLKNKYLRGNFILLLLALIYYFTDHRMLNLIPVSFFLIQILGIILLDIFQTRFCTFDMAKITYRWIFFSKLTTINTNTIEYLGMSDREINFHLMNRKVKKLRFPESHNQFFKEHAQQIIAQFKLEKKRILYLSPQQNIIEFIINIIPIFIILALSIYAGKKPSTDIYSLIYVAILAFYIFASGYKYFHPRYIMIGNHRITLKTNTLKPKILLQSFQIEKIDYEKRVIIIHSFSGNYKIKPHKKYFNEIKNKLTEFYDQKNK